MKDELEQKLVQKYPGIFRDYHGDMRQTCMTWGFECGDGWFNLIDKLCSDITKICEKNKKKNIEVIAVQVKEKFGGLRFYYDLTKNNNIFSRINYRIQRLMFSRKMGIPYWWMVNQKRKIWQSSEEKIDELVEQAQAKSYEICEDCGEAGKERGGCWIRTLCDKCVAKGTRR